MQQLLQLIIIAGVIFVLYWIYRFLAPYFIRITNIFYVSGSPGTGKDVITSNYAIKRFRVAVRKWRIRKFFISIFKRKKLKTLEPMPIFYSSIPILLNYSRKKPIYSVELTLDILLLKKRLPNESIVYISDINRFVSQHTFNNENVKQNISEFISEYRQYTKGGYFICNSQSSDQVAKEIRMTFGKVRNNLAFHKFLCFYRIEGRTITLSENVLSVEQGDADSKMLNNMTYIYGFLNPFIRRYDTYAYYGRVADMPIENSKQLPYLNTNLFLELPQKLQNTNTLKYGYGSYKKIPRLNKLAIFMYAIFGSLIFLIFSILINSAIPFFIYICLYFTALFDALK